MVSINYKFVQGIISILGIKNVLSVKFTSNKRCNFNCLYCEKGWANNTLASKTNVPDYNDIFEEVKHYLTHHNDASFVMLSCCGESALYSGFGALALKIKEEFPEIGIMTYVNAIQLSNKAIQQELSLCHILGCNIDSVFEDEFQMICRPSNNLSFTSILEGLKDFSRHFKGMLLVDSKFVSGINDSEESLDSLLTYLSEIQPNHYIIYGTQYQGQKLSENFTNLLREKMDDLPFPVSLHL